MRTIATAGHVDHGKSSLVRALTGTDPDRLAEEQARGLTIDLGFAFAELPSGRRIGFVDVPGHARFLPNMLAGAGAVDLALFVVAADEGWCAQSREHLQILDLLGAAGGVIALTKVDRVERGHVDRIADTVRARTHGTVLDCATVVACDSLHGTGIDELRAALDALLDAVGPPADLGRPRLWVDRAFSVKGAGTVVTGTLEGGQLSVGRPVLLVSADARSARIRGLESGGRPVDVADPGARVAVNLAGLERSQVARGDVVVRDGQWQPTAVVDGRVRLEAAPPTSRAALHVHVGSAKLHGQLRVVDGFGRVRLDRAVPLVPGDRLILRDPGPSAILGSLEVLDVHPAARLDPDRLQAPAVERCFLAEPWQRREGLGPSTGLDDRALEDELRHLIERGAVVELDPWFVRADEHDRATAALVAAAAERSQPLADTAATLGLTRDQVKSLAQHTADVTLHQNVVRHREAVETAATPAGRAVMELLRAQPYAPPDPREVVHDPRVLTALVREGAVTKCNDIWFASDALARAAELVVTELATRPQLAVSDLRDLFQSSRKYALAIAGWLDAIGVTRRQGDVRVRGAASVPTTQLS
ncbi:MAG TPA: selenocysteine-specific translation elongation factor [Acidimicrobiia bacterium]|nr:selenocysteine-specific translation elongation factor [Acidimicrobiia bacterium]